MQVFENAAIGNITIKNRIIRSATFEGMCSDSGVPGKEYFNMYAELAKNSIGAIITGFAFVSQEGKAMQPGQAGIDHEDKVEYFKKVTDEVHRHDCRIFMQLAHTGRQTRESETGQRVFGVSGKKSLYFGSKPEILKTEKVYSLADRFAQSAWLAKKAGFDGIQLHAAHGYLIHQFLLSAVNNRKDEFGIDSETALGTAFLDLAIKKVRDRCGTDYPILVKISAGDDYFRQFTKKQFISLVQFLDRRRVDAIEISYGTMDYALNIIRGEIPVNLILKVNPVYKLDSKVLEVLWKVFVYPLLKLKIKPFTHRYNLEFAKLAKEHTDIPVMCVGGFRTGEEIENAVVSDGMDFISLCRPFICEPGFAARLKESKSYKSKCINCNYCLIMCDSDEHTKCYRRI